MNEVVRHTGRGNQPRYCNDPDCRRLRDRIKADDFDDRHDSAYDADKKVIQRCREWLGSREAITRRYFCGEIVAGFLECLSLTDREAYALAQLARAHDFIRRGRPAEARRICQGIRGHISPRDGFDWRVRQVCNDLLLYAGGTLSGAGGLRAAVCKTQEAYKQSVSAWYHSGRLEPARLTLALVGSAHQLCNYAGVLRSATRDLKEAAELIEAARHFSQLLPRSDSRRQSLRTLVRAKKVQIAVLAGQAANQDAALLGREEPYMNSSVRLEALEGLVGYWTAAGEYERAAECQARAIASISDPNPWVQQVAFRRGSVSLMLRWGKWEECEELLTSMIKIHARRPCASFRRQLEAWFHDFQRAGRTPPDILKPYTSPSIYGGFSYLWRENWTGDYSV